MTDLERGGRLLARSASAQRTTGNRRWQQGRRGKLRFPGVLDSDGCSDRKRSPTEGTWRCHGLSTGQPYLGNRSSGRMQGNGVVLRHTVTNPRMGSLFRWSPSRVVLLGVSFARNFEGRVTWGASRRDGPIGENDRGLKELSVHRASVRDGRGCRVDGKDALMGPLFGADQKCVFPVTPCGGPDLFGQLPSALCVKLLSSWIWRRVWRMKSSRAFRWKYSGEPSPGCVG